MSRSRGARRARGLLTLLMAYAVLSASMVLAPLTWGAASVRAAGEDVMVQVGLDSVSPAVAGPDTEVRVSGTLRNLGSTPTPVHSVRVSTAYRGLDTRGAVQEWAETGLLETPIVLAEDHIGVAVAPGSTVRWFADVPADLFDPGFEFATLPLRVEVMSTGPAPGDGSTEPGEEGVGTPNAFNDSAIPGAEVRSYLPWTTTQDAEFNPVQIAWLAPLTLPGDSALVDPDEARRAEAWAEAIGPDSRAVELLDGLGGTGATFVVDPALLEPLDPVASLTEVVELPGDQADPTESPEPTDSEPSNPATTDPAPTAEPTPPAATSGGAGGPATTQGSGATNSPTTGGSTGLPDDSVPTSAPDAGTTDPTEAPEPVVPPTPPTTESAVADLTERLGQIPEGQLWWLPVGDTDAGALLDLGVDVGEIAPLVGRTPAQGLTAPGRTDVAWPLSETFNDGMIGSLHEVWAAAGDAAGAAGPGNGSLGGVVLPVHTFEDALLTGSAVRTHASGSQLIGYDEGLSGIVAASGQEGQDGRAVQRFLAETLAVYQEGPASDRSVVIAIPRTAEVNAASLQALTGAAAGAPWLEAATVEELMAAAAPLTTVEQAAPEGGSDAAPAQGADPTEDPGGGSVLGDLAAYSQPGESPLSPPRINRVELARTEIDGVSEIVPGTREAHRTWLRVLDRQYSASWRAAPQEWEAPVEDGEDLAAEIQGGLTINPTTINLYADEGLMQVTVVNELPVPIEGLQMRVDPGNARLRILDQPEPITIGPESRATVQFRARAVAAGQVPLHTSLSTPNGTEVGQAEETVVRVQPTGVWIYWLLGGVAGVILVLGLVRALRPAGIRRGSAGAPGTTSEQNVATDGSDLEKP